MYIQKKYIISSNDDKRLQTFDKITTYPHGTNAFKVCESEMIAFKKYIWINKKRINQDKGFFIMPLVALINQSLLIL